MYLKSSNAKPDNIDISICTKFTSVFPLKLLKNKRYNTKQWDTSDQLQKGPLYLMWEVSLKLVLLLY